MWQRRLGRRHHPWELRTVVSTLRGSETQAGHPQVRAPRWGRVAGGGLGVSLVDWAACRSARPPPGLGGALGTRVGQGVHGPALGMGGARRSPEGAALVLGAPAPPAGCPPVGLRRERVQGVLGGGPPVPGSSWPWSRGLRCGPAQAAPSLLLPAASSRAVRRAPGSGCAAALPFLLGRPGRREGCASCHVGWGVQGVAGPRAGSSRPGGAVQEHGAAGRGGSHTRLPLGGHLPASLAWPGPRRASARRVWGRERRLAPCSRGRMPGCRRTSPGVAGAGATRLPLATASGSRCVKRGERRRGEGGPPGRSQELLQPLPLTPAGAGPPAPVAAHPPAHPRVPRSRRMSPGQPLGGEARPSVTSASLPGLSWEYFQATNAETFGALQAAESGLPVKLNSVGCPARGGRGAPVAAGPEGP